MSSKAILTNAWYLSLYHKSLEESAISPQVCQDEVAHASNALKCLVAHPSHAQPRGHDLIIGSKILALATSSCSRRVWRIPLALLAVSLWCSLCRRCPVSLCCLWVSSLCPISCVCSLALGRCIPLSRVCHCTPRTYVSKQS